MCQSVACVVYVGQHGGLRMMIGRKRRKEGDDSSSAKKVGNIGQEFETVEKSLSVFLSRIVI